MDKQLIELTLTADIIQYTTIYWAQIDCECHLIHRCAMNFKQFIDLTFTIYIIRYSNMQWINKSFNSVWTLFLNLCIYRNIFVRYIIHLYLVLGICTQVHFAKPCTCTCTCTWTFAMYLYLYPSTESMYLPQPCSLQFLLICPTFYRAIGLQETVICKETNLWRDRGREVNVGQKSRGPRTVPWAHRTLHGLILKSCHQLLLFGFYWSGNFESN